MVTRIEEVHLADARLRLTTTLKEWCVVELIDEARHTTLGAETRPIVIDRLLSGFQKVAADSTAGYVDGIPVSFVMTFFERHYSLYAADLEHGLLLLFQAPDGTPFAQISLSPVARQTAVRELTAMLRNELTTTLT